MMKGIPRFPLLAKVLSWLLLHLVLLGFAFFLFIHWQLGLGLDSLLSGSAGERLASFGDAVVSRIAEVPPRRWNEEIESMADDRHVTAAIVFALAGLEFPGPVPPNVQERIRSDMPPQPDPAAPGPPHGEGRLRPQPGMMRPNGAPPAEGFAGDEPPPAVRPPGSVQNDQPSLFLPKSRPVFLMRADNGDGYWAGVLLRFPPARELPRRPVVLLIRADHLDGSGMFFDFKPWLWGGIAVLLLSLAFWTPFVWGITRYLRRLTSAAGDIATGRFQVSLPRRGNDELGHLGRTIESMASRLNHLVSGQKRFLGDAAHELCSPLARIRTGLGILETKLVGADASALSSIESDVAELAALVDEIMAFSRTGNRKPSFQPVALESLIRDVVAREARSNDILIDVPPNLVITTDPALLGRAVGNLIRNAAIHAGPEALVSISAVEAGDAVVLTVEDDGPGVPPSEISRVFEPFHRLDSARSRESGGSGLGLAIVRSAIETCGGQVQAAIPGTGGFAVTVRVPKQPPSTGQNPEFISHG